MPSATSRYRATRAAFAIGVLILIHGARADDVAGNTLPVDPLSKQWWQLYSSVPNAVRTKLGESPAACGLGQHGPVWFLSAPPGETVTRHCTIPRGIRLFVPLVTAICTPFPGETLAQNVQLCRELIDPFDRLSLTIDGNKRNGLIERRAQSEGFPVWFPEDNIFDTPGEDVPAGVYISVTEGQYALIDGLPLGQHTIRARALSTTDQTVPLFDAIYKINVVAPTTVTPR